MTPQEWQTVEERLKNFYTFVKLKCDGYDVTLCLKQINQFKNGLVVFVNGKIDGKWLVESCEERDRFMRPVKRYIHTGKERAGLRKLSKRLRPENKGKWLDPDAYYTHYSYYWTSFAALKRHLIKHNIDIKLIQEAEEHAALDANRQSRESADTCGQESAASG